MIKLFIWCTGHKSLPTLSMLHNREMTVETFVPDVIMLKRPSSTTYETVLGLSGFRERALGFAVSAFFTQSDELAWIKQGFSGPSPSFFLAALWVYWRARNRECLGNEIVKHFHLVF